jgi:aspartate kinase
VNEDQEILTLGRGASDTTAVALAVALGADRCENCKDVEGVYTADPRIVPTARKLKDITYEEMLELATQGSTVMHNRAVELASVYNLPILNSTWSTPQDDDSSESELEERNAESLYKCHQGHGAASTRQARDRDEHFEPLAKRDQRRRRQNSSEEPDRLDIHAVARGPAQSRALMPVICESWRADTTMAAQARSASSVGARQRTAIPRVFRALFDASINIDPDFHQRIGRPASSIRRGAGRGAGTARRIR